MKAISIWSGLAALSAAGGSSLWSADRAENSAAAAEVSARVDVNNAELSSLEAVPEIGARFAQAVVAARPFKSVDELQHIIKISAVHMDALRAKVTVLPPKKSSSSAGSNLTTPGRATQVPGAISTTASDQERNEARRRHIRRDGLSMAEPPPGPREESKSESPGPNYVWKPGHWAPAKGEWKWTPGEWAVPPTSISVWIDGTYDAKEQRWSPGYWEPDTIRVSEPAESDKR
jgi:hypothetical protein